MAPFSWVCLQNKHVVVLTIIKSPKQTQLVRTHCRLDIQCLEIHNSKISFEHLWLPWERWSFWENLNAHLHIPVQGSFLWSFIHGHNGNGSHFRKCQTLNAHYTSQWSLPRGFYSKPPQLFRPIKYKDESPDNKLTLSDGQLQ